MNTKSLLILLFSIITIGCEALIEAERVLNSSNIESYDHGICNSGEPSRPNEPKRGGCVNNISEDENREAYINYKTERDLYLNEK